MNGWLGVLKFLSEDFQVLIPESVEKEIRDQSHTEPELKQILTADWILVDRSSDIEFLEAFAHYARMLAVGDRNLGECGVLALGKTRRHELIIDDRVASKHAAREGLMTRGTLGLLCEAIRGKQLTVPMVSGLADDLLSGDYRLPFQPGGFTQWAETQGLLPALEVETLSPR